VHWTRNALAYVPKAHQTMVAAGLRQAFQQPDPAAARASLSHFADQLHNRWPKLKVFVDDSLDDVLAYLSFPAQHRTKLHSTDEIDKHLSADCGSLSVRGRPRGKEWGIDCKPRQAA
jgi:transposase-like protein